MRIVVPVVAVVSGLAVAGVAVAVTGRSQEPPSDRNSLSVSSESGKAWQVLREGSTAASSEQHAPAKPAAPVPQHAPPPQTQVFVATQDRPILRTAKAETAPDRAALTRALQRELKRVGCYHGEISGVWSPSTRHASEAFLALANARLPVAEPDPVLLALVQGSRSTSCVAPCPQARTMNGICREGVVAGIPAGDKSGSPNAPAATPNPGFEAPMGLNGPQAPDGENGALSSPPEQKTPAARNPRRNASHAPREDWRAKLWRNSVN